MDQETRDAQAGRLKHFRERLKREKHLRKFKDNDGSVPVVDPALASSAFPVNGGWLCSSNHHLFFITTIDEYWSLPRDAKARDAWWRTHDHAALDQAVEEARALFKNAKKL